MIKAILINLMKREALSGILEPEKILKVILFAVFIPILVMVILIAIPIILITNIPNIIMGIDSEENKEINATQKVILQEYVSIDDEIESLVEEWKEEDRAYYRSDYDRVRVNSDEFYLWKEVLAIDTVIKNQDFTDVKKKDILDIAKLFVKRTTSTDTDREKYYVEEEYTDPETGEKKKKEVAKYRTIYIKYVKYSMKEINTVMDELNFSDEEKNVALQYINGIDILYNETGVG